MNNEFEVYVQTLGEAAKRASYCLASLTREEKDQVLMAMADRLEASAEAILEANQKDLALGKTNGLRETMRDRLTLTEERIHGIAVGIREVVCLEDPTGKVLEETVRPNGLSIQKVAVPLGVVLMMYEARPNVTVDAAVLTLKTGNAVILRGGKEAFYTNQALVHVLQECLKEANLPKEAIQLVELTDRALVTTLLQAKKYIDVVIPRGSAGLIERVVRESYVPVIETGSGVVHIYVDEFADVEKAIPIIINAKVQRPSVCNSVETLLIHEKVAETLLPALQMALTNDHVKVRGDKRTLQISGKLADELPHLAPIFYDMEEATEEDFYTEYNDLIVSMKIVSSVDEAISHIQQHSTKHSEAILTENEEIAKKFLTEVDASTVYVNASTRFTDGFEFGFGAEIGISTQKLHARGPMGLPVLTTYKYLVRGNGQTRS